MVICILGKNYDEFSSIQLDTVYIQSVYIDELKTKPQMVITPKTKLLEHIDILSILVYNPFSFSNSL